MQSIVDVAPFIHQLSLEIHILELPTLICVKILGGVFTSSVTGIVSHGQTQL